MKALNILILAVSLIFMITTGCSKANSKQIEPEASITSLTDEIGTDFKTINKIEVLYGDGSKITIDNEEDLSMIAEKLRLIQMKEISSVMGPGYLYILEIHQGDNIFKISNTITIDDKPYKPVGNEIQELNKVIIDLGRKQFPELLAGIDI